MEPMFRIEHPDPVAQLEMYRAEVANHKQEAGNYQLVLDNISSALHSYKDNLTRLNGKHSECGLNSISTADLYALILCQGSMLSVMLHQQTVAYAQVLAKVKNKLVFAEQRILELESLIKDVAQEIEDARVPDKVQ